MIFPVILVHTPGNSRDWKKCNKIKKVQHPAGLYKLQKTCSIAARSTVIDS